MLESRWPSLVTCRFCRSREQGHHGHRDKDQRAHGSARLSTSCPRINSVLGQDLSYIALKGYDHYLCLRKLEHMARADQGDNCDVISMIATLLNFTAQTSHGTSTH